jgi:hypothetical protein
VHREVEHPYSTQGQQLRQTQEPQNQWGGVLQLRVREREALSVVAETKWWEGEQQCQSNIELQRLTLYAGVQRSVEWHSLLSKFPSTN